MARWQHFCIRAHESGAWRWSMGRRTRPRAPYSGLQQTCSMEEDMARADVLIVGAGPTGLVLALWLTKLGAKPRIIDKAVEPGTTSRALAVHARTLELYRTRFVSEAHPAVPPDE